MKSGCNGCGGPRFGSQCLTGLCKRDAPRRRRRLTRAESARLPEIEALEWRAEFDGKRTAQWRAYSVATNRPPQRLCLHNPKAPAHQACRLTVLP